MTLWTDVNGDPSIRWPLWRRMRWGLAYGVTCGLVVFLVSLLFTDWTNGLVYERAGPWDLNQLMAQRLIGMPVAGAVAGALLPLGARRYGGYLLGPIVMVVAGLPGMMTSPVYLYTPVPRWQFWLSLPVVLILTGVLGQQMTEPLRGKPMGELPDFVE